MQAPAATLSAAPAAQWQINQKQLHLIRSLAKHIRTSNQLAGPARF